MSRSPRLTTRVLPRVVGSNDLSLAELCAARMDGELMVLGESWTPVDEPDSAELRAEAVAAQVGSSRRVVIACDLTAAWILGATAIAPKPISLCTRRCERIKLRLATRFVHTERGLGQKDWITVDSLRVTTPLRTAIDLARGSHWSDSIAEAVARLIAKIPNQTGRFESAARARPSGISAAAIEDRLDHVRASAHIDITTDRQHHNGWRCQR